MDWPAVETDMHARHDWLCRQELLPNLSADPDWFDAKVAGWWAYGQVLFIGNAWCQNANQAGRRRLSSVPRGIIHKSARVGGTTCPWRNRSQGACPKRTVRGFLHNDRKSPNQAGQPVTSMDYLEVLAARLADTRFYCKHLDSKNRKDDWLRLLCPATFQRGRGRPVAVFLDPPYAHSARAEYIYGNDDTHEDADQLRQMLLSWCAHRGADPMFRIVVCGYAGEYDQLEALGWTVREWTGRQGQARPDNLNRFKERLWLSPV
jgi:hypothetical protein